MALIDAATKTVLATIPVGKGPGFPIFSPDGSRLYVMNYGMGDIAVIDTATRLVDRQAQGRRHALRRQSARAPLAVRPTPRHFALASGQARGFT